jgi:hypothetical protein
LTSSDNRHIGLETLLEYASAGVQASIPIEGDPSTLLTIDAPNDELRLDVSWDGEEPPAVGEYLHISTGVSFRGGRNWATVTIHGTRFFAEAYPLLRKVADQVQLEGMTFAESLQSSLANYHDLLAAMGQMSALKEVGLFGELTVVSYLIASMGARAALEAWRGGDQLEEHDLGLPDDDVEIKTTTAESRRHWISGIDQLRATESRNLWLLSLQLTGAGVSDGERLPDLIDRVESQLPDSLRPTYGARIARTGFRVQQPRESFRRLRFRASPLCFPVTGDFPRLDSRMLGKAAVPLNRIHELNYTIHLDGMEPEVPPPHHLRGFVEGYR